MNPASVKRKRKPAGVTPPPASIKRMEVRRNMTIYEAESLKDEFLNAVAQSGAIELDLSQVVEIDTAGLQVLILAWRESRGQGKTLRVAACSPAVQELMELCNLAELFDGAQALAAHDAVQA